MAGYIALKRLTFNLDLYRYENLQKSLRGLLKELAVHSTISIGDSELVMVLTLMNW